VTQIPEFEVRDLGRLAYVDALALQRALADARRRGEAPDTLLFVEHDPVITLGRARASKSHVIAPGDVPVVEVERGGDDTWHGPGQLVGYPVFLLAPGERDIHQVLRGLEGAIIDVLTALGLPAERVPPHTGVWCRGRKLASIGVAVSGWVTTHGFALNVSPDLCEFARIAPCGLEASVMGSIAALGREVPAHAWLVRELASAVGRHFRRVPRPT